jgi:hypothetical protein
MDSPKIIAKKKAYRDKIMKELHPDCELFIYAEEDLGNENWFFTAQLLASENPELVVLANCMLNTPTEMVFYDKDGKIIEFTEDDDDEPEKSNGSI